MQQTGLNGAETKPKIKEIKYLNGFYSTSKKIHLIIVLRKKNIIAFINPLTSVFKG